MGTCCSLGADVPEVLVRDDACVDSALHVYVPALAYVTDVILARVFKLPWFVWYVSILALYENMSIFIYRLHYYQIYKFVIAFSGISLKYLPGQTSSVLGISC